MAIVSKAVFEKEARGLAIGDVWKTDRYASNNKGLAVLDGGGDLYLVTVRPPEVLCLVAVMKAPKHGADGWRAKPNTVAIRDISAARTQLTFAGGAPLPTKAGTLGMSLQTPRVLTDDDIALLTGGGPATKPATKPTPHTRSKKPGKSSPSPVAEAARQVRSPSGKPAKPSAGGLRSLLSTEKPGDALPALLELWRTEPSVELASHIKTVSRAAHTDLAGVYGKSHDALATWSKLAKQGDLAKVPALLASLTDAPSGDAVKRLAVVAKWMPDPRVDAAIADWLVAPPYHATMTKPFWVRVFAIARDIRDPAQLPRLEHADAKIKQAVAVTMGTWLRAELAKLIGVLRPILADVPATTPAACEVAAAADALRVDSSDLDTLLAAVLAAPESDDARLVYADALSERGDLRGELIAVQCGLARAPDNRELLAREKELLDAHGKQWLGELSKLVMTDHRFERGFLASCRVESTKRNAARALAGHAIWSTVHTLCGPLEVARHPVMRSLRAFRYDGWDEENNPDDDDYDPGQPAAWHDLLAGRDWPLESLTYRTGLDRDALALEALAECKALPRLRTLILEEDPYEVVTLFGAPVLTRLQTFGLQFNSHAGWIDTCAPLFEKAPTPRLTLQISHHGFHPTIVELSRSDAKSRRSYAAAKIEVGPTTKGNWADELVEEVIQLIRALPGLRTLNIKKRKGVPPEVHARLTKAINALNLDTWTVG